MNPSKWNFSFFLVFAFLLGIIFISSAFFVHRVFLSVSSAPEVFSAGYLTDSFATSTPTDVKNELVFAFNFPRGEVVKSLEILSPKFSSISKPLNKSARLEACTDETEIVKLVEHNKVFLGAISAVNYSKTRKKSKIKAVLERVGKTPKYSLFLVRKDDSMQTIEELRGKKIAFKSRDSLSGFHLPTMELKKRGLNSQDFSYFEIITGNFENSIHGLIQKEYDCAVISSTFFEELEKEQRDSLKSLHQTNPVPGGVYITSSRTSEVLLKEFIEVFERFGQDVSAAKELGGFFRVKIPDEASYETLEGLTEDGDK